MNYGYRHRFVHPPGLAVVLQNMKCVEYLLDHGADIDFYPFPVLGASTRAMTALHHAMRLNDDYEMMKFLLKRGANPNLVNILILQKFHCNAFYLFTTV